jgi:hypothetical protein
LKSKIKELTETFVSSLVLGAGITIGVIVVVSVAKWLY